MRTDTAVLLGDTTVQRFRANLTGYDEVPLIMTSASGRLDASLSDDETELAFTLTWSDLESAPRKAHIHLGKEGINGGDIVTLCSWKSEDEHGHGVPRMSGLNGSAEGTVTAEHVVDVSWPLNREPVPQGIAAGEFAKFVAALKKGVCYVNIHTKNYQAPAGLIRGQILKSLVPKKK